MHATYRIDSIRVVAHVPGTYLQPGSYTATRCVDATCHDSYVEVVGATDARELIPKFRYAAGVYDGKIVIQHSQRR